MRKYIKELEKEIEEYEEMLDAMMEDDFNKEYAERVIEESHKLGLLDVPTWMS